MPQHSPYPSLVGQRFGRWTVIADGPTNSHFLRYSVCRCDCGQEKTVQDGGLRNGKSQSCGCIQRERLIRRITTHGLCRSPEYRVWASMISRCTIPHHHHFPSYGGRGIGVCSRWRDSFQAFYDDMGPRPSPKHTIDRTNNELGYFPENCRWVTWHIQALNKRSNRFLVLNGIKLTISEWAKKLSLSHDALTKRVDSGWSEERILNTPPKPPMPDRRHIRFLTLNGITLSATEWSKKLGVSYVALSARIDSGWSDEKTLMMPFEKYEPRGKVFEFHERRLTLKEWSKELGIKYSTLHQRFMLGWSVDDILTRPTDRRKCSAKPQ